MRNFILIAFLFFVACSSGQNREATNQALQQKQGDSVFFVNDFMFKAEKNMKFEFLKNGEQADLNKVKGDVLYQDDNLKIVGNYQQMKSGIYCKFDTTRRFSDFKVDTVYKSKLHIPDFKSDKDAEIYKDRLMADFKYAKVDFAGHYTVLDIRFNGTEAAYLVLVDCINGKIFYSGIPFNDDDGPYGLIYEANSRLMIVNSKLIHPDFPNYYLCSSWSEISVRSDGKINLIYPCNFPKKLMYYEFTGKDFVRLQ